LKILLIVLTIQSTSNTIDDINSVIGGVMQIVGPLLPFFLLVEKNIEDSEPVNYGPFEFWAGQNGDHKSIVLYNNDNPNDVIISNSINGGDGNFDYASRLIPGGSAWHIVEDVLFQIPQGTLNVYQQPKQVAEIPICSIFKDLVVLSAKSVTIAGGAITMAAAANLGYGYYTFTNNAKKQATINGAVQAGNFEMHYNFQRVLKQGEQSNVLLVSAQYKNTPFRWNFESTVCDPSYTHPVAKSLDQKSQDVMNKRRNAYLAKQKKKRKTDL